MKILAKYNEEIALRDFALDFVLERLLRRKIAQKNSIRYEDFYVKTRDYIGNQVIAHDIYEKKELRALAEFLTPIHAILKQGIGLDVGANIGNHTLFFAPLLRQIKAFEPNPEIIPLLKLNTKNIPNVKIYEIGLSGTKTRMLLHIDSKNIGGSSVVKERGVSSREIEIELMPLDVLGINCDGLQLIKLDVEGHEYEVLLGGKETIQNSMPLILLEQFPTDFDITENRSIAFLRNLGYTFVWFAHDSISRNTIQRRAKKLFNLLIRKETTFILTNTKVPRGHYPMLIAVPPRFFKLLNLD